MHCTRVKHDLYSMKSLTNDSKKTNGNGAILLIDTRVMSDASVCCKIVFRSYNPLVFGVIFSTEGVFEESPWG